FRSRLRAITQRQLNTKNVESAERLARTTTRQPLANGTRTRNQPGTRSNNVLVSDHRYACYSLVWSRVVERPGDPFASLDLAVLGSAHVVSGLSCWGRVMSDVVGSGWTHVTFLRTVGVGRPGLASLTPLSGGGSGPSRVLSFVIFSPRSGFFGRRSSG